MTKRTCNNCGKEYTPTHTYSKYCSKRCYYKYISLKEKICPVCNNIFIPKNKKQIHCNIKCYSNSSKLKEEGKNSKLIKENKTRVYLGPRNTKPNNGSFKRKEKSITPIFQRIKSSTKYKMWRTNVFKRDNWSCKTCGTNKEKIYTHHIVKFFYILKKNNIQTLEQADNCEILWDIDNGITLCKTCHNLVHGKKK